jgi:hypothetical protein
MIPSASLSFTDANGLKDSTLTYISTPSGAMWFSLTTGVEPIVSMMLL